jgi:hypothetical protein
MVKETINTGLSEASQLLVEVDKLPDGGERVVVCTLWGRSRSQDVAEKSSVTDLLVGHELDQKAILRSETGVLEIFNREHCQAVVEKIQLDPFLIQSQSERLVIEIGNRMVVRKSAVGA